MKFENHISRYEFRACLPVGKVPSLLAGRQGSEIRKGRKAFTLMELLIAIGILAVGGAMAAALFPAAIKENQSSYNDTLGSIICQNGLATIKARTYATLPATSSFTIGPTTLGEADTPYPQPYLPKPTTVSENDPDWVNDSGTIRPKSTLGFVSLWREDGEAVGIIIVAYKKQNTPTVYSDIVKPLPMTTINAGNDNFTISAVIPAAHRSKLLHSYVVATNTGEYRKITGVQGSTAYLDEPFSSNAVNPWVFMQYESTGTTPVGVYSPVINILSARTALRP
ncbi:MAG: prepilin-type N-terminal cleavage/methylation domain-containing protein [Phycisphaerae bacterium]|nr:prepilin-type N-terminal cleavage/methylation domain-containing protein [Phycisphaerae bacterium]